MYRTSLLTALFLTAVAHAQPDCKPLPERANTAFHSISHTMFAVPDTAPMSPTNLDSRPDGTVLVEMDYFSGWLIRGNKILLYIEYQLKHKRLDELRLDQVFFSAWTGKSFHVRAYDRIEIELPRRARKYCEADLKRMMVIQENGQPLQTFEVVIPKDPEPLTN